MVLEVYILYLILVLHKFIFIMTSLYVTISVATGLLKISPDFFSKTKQKNPDGEN